MPAMYNCSAEHSHNLFPVMAPKKIVRNRFPNVNIFWRSNNQRDLLSKSNKSNLFFRGCSHRQALSQSRQIFHVPPWGASSQNMFTRRYINKLYRLQVLDLVATTYMYPVDLDL